MFMPGLWPGALGWGVHHDFARAVERRGHQFDLVTTVAGPSRPTATSVRALATREPWRILGRAAAPVLRTPSLVPTSAALAGHLRRAGHEIDLLHVEVAYPHGAAAVLAARVSGWSGPIVVTPMGEDILVLDEASYGFRRHVGPRWLVRWTLEQASFVRCISPMLDARIRRIAPDTPRRVVPLSVSSETVTVARESLDERVARREQARASVDAYGAVTDRPRVLALGRLHPFKGLETLVRAMPAVRAADLLIAGPSLAVSPFGDMASRLLRVARDVGVGDRVRWVGQVAPEHALELLAAADVVVVPSILESLNKVCVEAAAVGTPFVVTETTGIAAWVTDDGVGQVVRPSDPAALSDALNRVISGQWRHDPVRAGEFAASFAPDAIATQVIEIYESVSGG